MQVSRAEENGETSRENDPGRRCLGEVLHVTDVTIDTNA